MIFTTQAQISTLAARLTQAQAVALDTEFLRERTYRAELCLLQLACGDAPVCVDPLAGLDLAPLAAALSADRPVKVMHACRQDIEVLLPALGMIRPVFDTQVAAGLCGLPAQIGYAELVRRVLGVELAKGQTRTDWSRRPLSAEQLEYALDDVRYLLPVRDHLLGELDRLGRSSWLAEEFSGLDDPSAYVVDPEHAWLRIRSLKGLDEDRARLAQSVAAWRERRAAERNRPRGWILDDALMREVVVRAPRTLEALAALPQMQPGFIKHSGQEILQLILDARLPEALPRLNTRPQPDPVKAALVKKLGAVNQAVAAELVLSAEILATRKDLEQLAEGRQDIPVLRGWRRAIIGDRLLAAL